MDSASFASYLDCLGRGHQKGRRCMLDNPQGTGDQMEALKQLAQRLTPGRPVYDEHGDKVGVVDEFHEEWGHFCMRKGVILRKDVYVPLQNVGIIDDAGVHLNVTRDYMDGQHWDQPPIAGGTSPTLGLGHTVRVPGATGREGADNAARASQHPEQQPLSQAAGEEQDRPAETAQAGELGRLDEPNDEEQAVNPPLF
jgi:hypothetical protein